MTTLESQGEKGMAVQLDVQSAKPIATGQNCPIFHLQERWRFLARRVGQLRQDGHDDPTLDQAAWHLYCARYHSHPGQSSGPPQPTDPAQPTNLDDRAESTRPWTRALSADARYSIRRNLIEAENLLDQFTGQQPEAIEAILYDFNEDGDAEVRLANSRLIAWLAPASGGQLFGLDAREAAQNVLAEGLPSFVEYFWCSPIQSGEVQDFLNRADGNFARQGYHGQLRQGAGRVQVLLQQQAMVYDLPLRVSKALTMIESSDELEISYLIEGLPDGWQVNFGSLWHWAGFGTETANRFVHDLAGHRLGSCQRSCYLPQSSGIGLCDVWSGMDLQLRTPDGCRLAISSAPPATASTESHHYLAVLPHWTVTGDQAGRWSTKFSLRVEPSPSDVRKRIP